MANSDGILFCAKCFAPIPRLARGCFTCYIPAATNETPKFKFFVPPENKGSTLLDAAEENDLFRCR